MRTRSRSVKINPVFAIVVEGETEAWYFQMLKRHERDIRVNIKPEIPGKKSLAEQYKLVRDLSKKEYTKVFWIIDLDTLVSEDSRTPKGKKSPLTIFHEYRKNLARNCKNVVVIVNNPCLEFWFLLHFETTSRQFVNCSSAERRLRGYLTSYEKTKRFFTQENNDIYLMLKPHLNEALLNSIALGDYDHRDPSKAMCEMELLFYANEIRGHFE